MVAALLHDVGWKLAGAAPFKIDDAAKSKSAAKAVQSLADNDVADLGPMDGNNLAEATNPAKDCFAAQLGILKTIIAEGASEEQQRAARRWAPPTLRMRGFNEKVPHLSGGHVLAKRHLCYKEDGYLEKLSPGSKRTLSFQGGPMTPEEAAIFETDPLFKDSLAMRRWDEEAKYAGLKVPSFESYKDAILAAICDRAKTAEETLDSCSYLRDGNTIVGLR